MTRYAPLLALTVVFTAVACTAVSPLGTDPVGATANFGSSTTPTAQPTSIGEADGGFMCATEPDDVYAGCPADPSGVVDGTPCALPTRTVCDYQLGTGWGSCSCMPTAFGNRWSCASGGDAQDDCPTVRPVRGAACGSNDFNRTCRYLRSPACTCAADRNAPFRRGITCICSEALGAWVCANEGQDGMLDPVATPDAGASGLPPFDESPCYGSPIALPTPPLNESKIINQLSSSEIKLWCGWCVAQYQGKGPEPSAVGGSWGLSWCGGPDGLPGTCIADVPVTVCEQMMQSGSCDAPVQALDDCYLTLVNECEVVGNGCETLESHPGCLQTIVQMVTSPSTPPLSCAIPAK
jgi:hypothetical protein